MMISCITVGASFNDVDSSASYSASISRIQELGIMNGSGDGNFYPNDNVTREQFAKIIIVAAGLEENAKLLSGSTVFSDVSANDWSTGYINLAVNKGYITGKFDGKFGPKDNLTFAEICTILVKALGYTDSDLSGVWPKNYIDKAKILGVTAGLDFKNSDAIPRSAVAVMVDKFLNTNIKVGANAQDKTFAESTGIYSDYIILGTYKTMDKLTEKQVITDKGILYLSDSNKVNFEVGNKYKLAVKKDIIVGASSVQESKTNIAVSSILDNKVTYFNTIEDIKTLTLPDKTVYYYKGAKQSYENAKGSIAAGSSIILTENSTGTGYEYAVILDPIMDNYLIVNDNTTNSEINSFTNGKSIINNGTSLTVSEVLLDDIIYQVKDIWGKTHYNMLIRSYVKGKITGILPNKYSPTAVQVDNKDYALGKDFKISSINSSPGSFKVGDAVLLIQGSDGKVVDIRYLDSSNNANYALVLNSSYAISNKVGDFGKIVYSVKLLLTDGNTITYSVDYESSKLKGKLVKYTKLDDKRASLEELEYLDANEHVFDINSRLLDTTYVADNAVVFNIISNDSNAEVKAEVRTWKDMPYGRIQANKVLYTNQAGAFNDINVILTNDILDSSTKLAVIKSISSGKANKNYTLIVEGKEYQFTSIDIPTAAIGSVFKVKMANNAVSSIVDLLTPASTDNEITAIDTKRIKVNDNIYFFKNNFTLYRIDSTGNILTTSINDIEVPAGFGKVAVYLDKTQYYGGKVEAVVIFE